MNSDTTLLLDEIPSMQDAMIIPESTSTSSLLDLSLSPTQLHQSHTPLLPLSYNILDDLDESSPVVLEEDNLTTALPPSSDTRVLSDLDLVIEPIDTVTCVEDTIVVESAAEGLELEEYSITTEDAINSIDVNDLRIGEESLETSALVLEGESVAQEEEEVVILRDTFEDSTACDPITAVEVNSDFGAQGGELGGDGIEEEVELTEIEIEVEEELLLDPSQDAGSEDLGDGIVEEDNVTGDLAGSDSEDDASGET
jgi:hypothetical protein